VKPDIPPSIEQVILKALAKDPKDRFSTAEEFVAAWKHALEEAETVRHAPETSSTPTRYTVPADQTQRKPAPVKQAASKSGISTGWIVGCLAGACLLFSVAGSAILGANCRNITFLNAAATDTPDPSPTKTISPISNTNTPPASATSAVNLAANVLLEDDFSVSRDAWGTLTDSDSSIEYDGDALHMLIFKENYVAWSTPNDQDYDHTHVEVTALNNDTDPSTAFGFICAQQSKSWSFYYLAITPSGEYAIIKATDGKDDVLLTNNGKWGSSNLIAEKASSYRVGADCGNAKLTLYVDGKQIASVSDNTYGNGRVGLFIWSGEKIASADVTFDDFLITSLK